MANIVKIVFSPTGGTQRVADIVANELGTNVTDIDLSSPNFSGVNIGHDDIAVIAVPSFGGRAPRVAIQRLRKITANDTKAIIIAVYGNRAPDDTLLELSDNAKKCGFMVFAGIAAVAQHSIANQYATGRPNADDAAQLKDFARQITNKLKSNVHNEPSIPGNRPYKKSGPGLVPKCTGTCSNCKLCVSKCPVAAIDKNNPKIVDKRVCINCMRCVAICPLKARTVNPLMEKLVGIALKRACAINKQNQLFK